MSLFLLFLYVCLSFGCENLGESKCYSIGCGWCSVGCAEDKALCSGTGGCCVGCAKAGTPAQCQTLQGCYFCVDECVSDSSPCDGTTSSASTSSTSTVDDEAFTPPTTSTGPQASLDSVGVLTTSTLGQSSQEGAKNQTAALTVPTTSSGGGQRDATTGTLDVAARGGSSNLVDADSAARRQLLLFVLIPTLAVCCCGGIGLLAGRRYLRQRGQRKSAVTSSQHSTGGGPGRGATSATSSRHRSRRGTDTAGAPGRGARLSRGTSRANVGVHEGPASTPRSTHGAYVPAPARPPASSTPNRPPTRASGTPSTNGYYLPGSSAYTPGPAQHASTLSAYTPGPVAPSQTTAPSYTPVPSSFTGAQRIPTRSPPSR